MKCRPDEHCSIIQKGDAEFKIGCILSKLCDTQGSWGIDLVEFKCTESLGRETPVEVPETYFTKTECVDFPPPLVPTQELCDASRIMK